MPKIAFIHGGNAYKSEINAYLEYFAKAGYDVARFPNLESALVMQPDVEWHLLGKDYHKKVPNRLKIHEYTCLSSPPFPQLKNQLKRWLNVVPDLRVFGKSIIADGYGFKDNVPYRFRDAGVAQQFFIPRDEAALKFDFIYVGTMAKVRGLAPTLRQICRQMPDKSILLIGTPDQELWRAFKGYPNITFLGKIPYHEVPKWLAQSRYALNCIPDRYPFHQQRPLKLMEYCAAGLPVISTDYPWVQRFAQKHQARFFFLSEKGDNLKWDALQNFEFHTPSVAPYTWERILDESGIAVFLAEKLLQQG